MSAEVESKKDMPENKILLLSKCVERRFAEMLFYDGVLHFGYPSEWIKKAEEGNVGQGDLLEGVYTNEITPWKRGVTTIWAACSTGKRGRRKG